MLLVPDFLRSAPPSVRTEFVRSARPVQAPVGCAILIPGQSCAAFSFVVRGSVRVHLIGRGGREITLYRVENGHGCVLTASCILGRTGFPASAVVDSAVTGAAVSSPVFRDWVGRHAFWREYVFRLVGERIALVLARFEEAAFDRLEARLARMLLRRLKPGERTILATHETMANELGSAREVVSRTLKRWSDSRLVGLRRGAVDVLDSHRIELLACGPSKAAG